MSHGSIFLSSSMGWTSFLHLFSQFGWDINYSYTIHLQLWLFWLWAILWEGTDLCCFRFFLDINIHYANPLSLILQPSEQNTYADIEAVYRCLIETYGASEDNIILYGQSVGSGPTLDLASRLTRLRAVVLHSPILSGLRVMYPVKHTYWFDIYKVINLFFPLILFIT
jgi:hypothetical protein